MSEHRWPPEGEDLLLIAHGFAVTWDEAGRYIVWVQHPSGRWIENRIWQGPRDPAEAHTAAMGQVRVKIDEMTRVRKARQS